LQDVPDVASAATSKKSSVACPDASFALGDTTGDAFDAVADVVFVRVA